MLLKWISFMVLILATVQFFALPIPWPQTIESPWQYEKLWSDAFYKQVSGYALLAILLSGILLSARRAVFGNSWGRYVTWRSVHSVLGFLGVVIIFAHTGLRLGSGLNLLLAGIFLALLILGGLTALLIAAFSPTSPGVRQLRSLARNVHQCGAYLALLLISFHIAMFYYF
jgi:nitrite reductase (NADH) large subunit